MSDPARRHLGRVAWFVLAAASATGSIAVAAPADGRRSGYDFMSPELQRMERDDGANPAFLAVQDGAAAWRQPAGARARSCADCHGDASTSMRGVAARYPAFDVRTGRAIDLRQRIAACQAVHQEATPAAPESDAALALESFIALQSRGLPVAPPDDPRLAMSLARGAQLFTQRMGQLDLSCAQCHDLHAGRHLGGSTIPQAHPTGYPVYRLEWQALGSLQRRLRACMAGVRAEPFAFGAQEWIDLELFLDRRAAGMPMDAPAVRP